MAKKNITLKLEPSFLKDIDDSAKKLKITRSEYIRIQLSDVQSSGDILKTGGEVNLNDSDYNALRTVGLSSVAGIGAYKLTKYLREKYSDNQNDLMDVLAGISVGVMVMIGDINVQTKK